MREIPQPETREEARDRLEEHIEADTWTNYGDVNPDAHGGMWVRYDADRQTFEAHRTFPAAEIGFDDADPEDVGDQYVWSVDVHWRDLFTDDGELSDRLHRVIDRLSGHEPDPLYLLAEEVDIRYYVADFPGEYGDGRRFERDSYGAVLDSIGVEPPEDD